MTAHSYDATDPTHPLGPLYQSYLDICDGHRARLLVWEFVKSLEPKEQCVVAAHVLNVSVGSYQNHGKSAELSSKRTGARVRKHWREAQKALADAEKLEPMVRKAVEHINKQPDITSRDVENELREALSKLYVAADILANDPSAKYVNRTYESAMQEAVKSLHFAVTGL